MRGSHGSPAGVWPLDLLLCCVKPIREPTVAGRCFPGSLPRLRASERGGRGPSEGEYLGDEDREQKSDQARWKEAGGEDPAEEDAQAGGSRRRGEALEEDPAGEGGD